MLGKGKGNKPPDKGKKSTVKASTSGVVTPTDPSSNLRSKIQDKAKVTVALIQELTEEDSENYLTDDEGQ